MKDFKKILSVFALTAFVIIALGFLTSNANADCIDDTGAAYGWCTAYCAMDCDVSFNPGCEKVAEKYEQSTSSTISCEGICNSPCLGSTYCCNGDCISNDFLCAG